ncbi:hypothetical protein KR044_010468 [Drosophila immigrans]|nr:hypothetical protein KR044_010468 [Drosophila immigrans]
MSLMDESFPTDELFDALMETSRSNSLKRQYSVCVRTAANEEHFQQQQQHSSNNETPFLNSDCSEETCASDPVGLERDRDHDGDKNDMAHDDEDGDEGGQQQQLRSARSNKAKSYQDIHSAYTKRRYKHVTSKVAKYIAELDGMSSKRQLDGNASSSASIQRHRSMPETLQQQQQMEQQEEESMSVANSSSDATNTAHARDESFVRLANFLQSQNNFLEARLYQKIDELRSELSECKDKLQRQSNNDNNNNNLHSLMYYPTTATATQTDLLSGIMATTATPHPNANLNDITYDSRDGSIEIPLLSVQHTTRQRLEPITNHNLQPLSLNFSDEVDANNRNITDGNESNRNHNGNRDGHTRTNNSGSSQPSSNDSAIEIVELPRSRSATVTVAPAFDWGQAKRVICFDKHSNRLVDLIPLHAVQASCSTASNNTSSVSNSNSSQSFLFSQYTTTYSMSRRRKKSLGMRLLSVFGPCARCNDPNQTMDATDATYTVGLPLLNDDSSRV